MSKKYQLHKITKKEAGIIADTYGIPEKQLSGDCYCLVSKKGNLQELNNEVNIIKTTISGRTETETAFKRAVEACAFFKKMSEEQEFEFKIPKMEDLIAGSIHSKKLKYPETSKVVITQADAEFFLKEETSAFFEKIGKVFNKLNDLKKDIPTLLPEIKTARTLANSNTLEEKQENECNEEYQESPHEEIQEEEDYER